MSQISSEHLIDRAVSDTGLEDFGQPTFRDGLDRLTAALTDESALTPTGAMIAEATVYGSLVNRLRIEAWWAAHPELADQKIEQPIVVVGMSRSGTTALSHLLGMDPGLRSLRRWEAVESVPPPDAASYWTDPRYQAAVEVDAFSDDLLPGFKAIHHDPPDAPVECNTLFAGEFASSLYWTTFFIPSYFRWNLASDSSSHYDFHRRQLALLQSKAPGRWNLKGPQHGLGMAALRERYPDAAIVVTHRDPAVCTASTASLISHLNGITSGSTDPVQIGALTTEFMSRCADGLVADAEQFGDDGMIHVSYPDLVADPIRVVEDVYRRLDRDLSGATRQLMCELIADRPQHKHGVHRYDMVDFGLDGTALDERFTTYRDRFDVDLEGTRPPAR